MDANAILSKLLETNFISNDHQTKISQMTTRTEQNKILLSHFMETCETEDLMEICDIITAVKGNRKLKRLGASMKDMLEKGQYCTCWCVQVKLCMLAHASYTIITSFHDYSISITWIAYSRYGVYNFTCRKLPWNRLTVLTPYTYVARN